jgi:hypothetical protein
MMFIIKVEVFHRKPLTWRLFTYSIKRLMMIVNMELMLLYIAIV